MRQALTRTAGAPMTVLDHNSKINPEEAWMRTPSWVGGNADDNSAVPVPPPTAFGGDENDGDDVVPPIPRPISPCHATSSTTSRIRSDGSASQRSGFQAVSGL